MPGPRLSSGGMGNRHGPESKIVVRTMKKEQEALRDLTEGGWE